MPERRRDEGRDPVPDEQLAPSPAQPLAPSAAAPSAARVLAMQRGAGNAAVSRWLHGAGRMSVARDGTPAPTTPAPPVPRVSYVFLMGDFKNDSFYLAAREYFVHQVPSAIVVPDKRTLADVIAHVNAQGKPVDTLFIVSHANEAGNLGFSLDAADAAKDASTGDKKPRTEFNEVKQANASKSLPTADVKLIDDQTKVQIKGCNVGRSTLMMDQLDEAFGGKASVTAPTHTQEYKFYGKTGGPVTYEENFAELFVEEPGVATKSTAELETAFKGKYSMIPQAKWATLLTTVKKEDKTRTAYSWKGVDPPADDEKSVLARIEASKKFPKDQKWVVSYKGRETVGTKYRYSVEAERPTPQGTEMQTVNLEAEIPPEESALIAQHKAKHGRPQACNWRVKRTVSGTQLQLDVIAERTEWVIDGTIKDAAGPYHPAQSDPGWYTTSTYAPPAPPPPPAPTP